MLMVDKIKSFDLKLLEVAFRTVYTTAVFRGYKICIKPKRSARFQKKYIYNRSLQHDVASSFTDDLS